MTKQIDHVAIFLAGDSTVANCPPQEAPMAGWGQVFQQFFQEGVLVVNKAKGGRSSNSFIEEGLLQEIIQQIKPNDYLFVQFGHNDQKPYGTEPVSTFPYYLSLYAEAARKKKAIPVFLTPVHRRHFDKQGNIVNTLGDYPLSMKVLAERLEVPLIDLWAKTKVLYESLGVEESKKLFVIFQPNEHLNYPSGIVDNTHFSEYGAKQVAQLVAEGIKELKLPLARYLVKND